jgi:hypothetical protein
MESAGGICARFSFSGLYFEIVSMTTKIGHSREIFYATHLGLISATIDSIGRPVVYEAIVDYVEREAVLVRLADEFEKTFGA